MVLSSPTFAAMGSPPLRPGTPPPLIADKIIRSRKGNPPQLRLAEMTADEISQVIECLVASNGLTDAFLLNAIGPTTRRLNLTSCYHIRKYTLGAIPQQCMQLESINLTNCRQADNKLVANLLSHCHNLQELVLDGCVRITDAALFPPDAQSSSLNRTLRRLRVLSLAGCRQVSAEALTRVAKRCVSLERVSVAGCRNAVTVAVATAFFDLSLRHGKLHTIDFSDCAVLSSDEAFVAFQMSTLPLRSVTLAGMSGLPPKYSARAIQALAHMCGAHLEELVTTWSSAVNDEACFALASNCPNLKRVNFCNSQVSHNGIELLLSRLRQMEEIDLSWCLKVNANAVACLADTGRLHAVSLAHCVDFLGTEKSPIGPSDILSLVHPKLARLDLTGLSRVITGELLQSLGSECSESLERLSGSLGGDGAVDIFVGMNWFASHCENLTHLNLDFSRIDSPPTGFCEAVRWPNLPELTHLTLTANPKNPFGDACIEAVLSGRTQLQQLELRNCGNITSELFHGWIRGYSPDREATLVVEAMIDSELQRGYMSSTSRQTVFGRYSDSDAAATVIFRGRSVRPHKFARAAVGSCSETDTMLGTVGVEMLRSAIVLNDAAVAVDNLQSLTLIGATQLTDASLDRLSLMATRLQSLEVLDVPLVTEEAVEPIRRRCKLLRSLHITGPSLRARIDSSKVFSRRHRKKSQAHLKRKIQDSDDDDMDDDD